LPIELIFFHGRISEDHVDLTWATAGEENFHYFSVHRVTSDLEFSEIGMVLGSGNSNIVRNYSFQDLNPLIGLSYYRLKAVDLDGIFEIFHVNSLEFEAEEVFRITPTFGFSEFLFAGFQLSGIRQALGSRSNRLGQHFHSQ